MRIFIIALSLGKSPVGIVNEKIINGLFDSGNQIMVACMSNDSKLSYENLEINEIKPGYVFPDRLTKLMTILIHISIQFIYWELKVYKVLKNKIKLFRPDIVYVLGSRGGESSLNLGMRISKKLKVPLAIHLVDPLPPPKGWETFEIYRRSIVKPIVNALKFANLISMNNPYMLKFQQSNLNFDILEKSYITPDPIANTKVVMGAPGDKKIITYLGSFYSARKPDSLIKGFVKYCEMGNDAELHIIGNNNIDLELLNVPLEILNKILMKKWTNDLNKVYTESSLLVDMDADIPGDVFISSKLKGYLALDRMVLSITRENSPARNFLANMKKSVIFSDHNYINVAKAIELSFNRSYDLQIFKERKEVIDILDVKNIVKDITSNFEKVIPTVN